MWTPARQRTCANCNPSINRVCTNTCTVCQQPFQSKAPNRKKCPSCLRCKECDKPLDRSHRVFCSKSCTAHWQIKNDTRVAEAFEHQRNNQSPEQIEKLKERCRLRAGIPNLKMRGAGNPRWKGGVPTDRPERMTLEYRAWVATVFKRDNYKCAMCAAAAAGSLEAHHIYPWISYPEKRFNWNNGITLCGPCHQSIKNKEHLFFDKFTAWVESRVPVTLTEEELATLRPVFANCFYCGKSLRRPACRRIAKRHFCNRKCQKAQDALSGWSDPAIRSAKRRAAYRRPHPSQQSLF